MFACGGISDPTRSGGENVATVSGALTGTAVPTGARVALVWRKAAGGVEVGAEAPIVGGQFSMTLGTPADGYFFAADASGYDELSGANPPPDSTEPAAPPAPSAGTGGGAPTPTPGGKLATKTNVSGGITEPMKVAVAGFVVYVDANGNGKLDLQGDYASSPDTILGGNKELFLAFLKGGGQLDYEKLRDKSGILPAAGYNLAWTEERWLPLTLVELKLTSNAKLPSPVCSSYGDAPVSGGGGGASGSAEPMPTPQDTDTASDGGAAPTTYPDPSDPSLSCAPDGRSYTYGSCPPPPPPPPVGLCSGDYGNAAMPCARAYNSFAGDTPPAGWPCPVAVDGGAADGGPAPDGGAN